MVSSVIAAIVNVVLNLWLIPIYGYIAAGYTTLFSYIIYALAHYAFMRRVINDIPHHTKLYNFKLTAFLSIILITIATFSFWLYTLVVLRGGLILFLSLLLVWLFIRNIDSLKATVTKNRKRLWQNIILDSIEVKLIR